MISAKLNKSNKCPETLQFKRKAMSVIKLVIGDDYFSKMTSYDSRNKTVLKPIKMQ